MLLMHFEDFGLCKVKIKKDKIILKPIDYSEELEFYPEELPKEDLERIKNASKSVFY